MYKKAYLNDNWKFSFEFNDRMTEPSYDESVMEDVRLPHTVKVTPFNYFDEKIYQTVSLYRRHLFIPAEYEGKRISLNFCGVAHKAVVYINGKGTASHSCGYTGFKVDISELVKYGEDNVIAVSVDSNETLDQPPFGFVIDYMTYGGIYRDVYIEISDKVYINDIFLKSVIEGRSIRLASEIEVINPEREVCQIKQYLKDRDGNEEEIASGAVDTKLSLLSGKLNVSLWDINDPSLFDIRTVLSRGDEVIDEKVISFGFRKAEFLKDGFYLNGKKTKIRGLNRHQSYPYNGYAMPSSIEENDAYILKKELGVNAVRTSHYPQSHDFISACDRLGLLVFTEIPGWQHIGGEAWKDIAVSNVKDMVLEYRNHPSIVLWGVRINESADDDEFYARTNKAAHELDPTRSTGGVRALKKSNLLEDVYTYNDFVHDGKAKGCERKKDVTSDINKPYLISEYNGHMFPTKIYDSEEHRREHALRHANVLDAVAKEDDIAGSFGWCMADYNTHKDFGSGDRICYHGVLDMFRNFKPAAYVYAAEGAEETVLELSSTMDIGEHPGCNRGDTYIYSNADSVKMYKNGNFIKEYFPSDSAYKNLKHGPVRIDDFIGDAIKNGEDFTKKQAETVKEILNATALYGMSNLPKRIWVKAGLMMLRYHMNFSDAVVLYNKYVGDWGGSATEYRFEAIKDGEVKKTVVKRPSSGLDLTVSVSKNELKETKSYDAALVRIKAVDDLGNQVFFLNEPVEFITDGPIEVMGDKISALRGGLGGVFVKTKGEAGFAALKIKTQRGVCAEVSFNITVEREDTM